MAESDGVKIKITGEGTTELRNSMQQVSSDVKSALDKVAQSLDKVTETSKKTTQDIVESNHKIQLSFSGIQGSINNATSGIASAMSTLRNTFAGVMGILAGGKLFGDSVASANRFAGEVGSLSKMMGITTQEASKYAVALRLVGKDADFLEGVSMRLGMQLRSQEETFTKLGVTVRNSQGDFLPFPEILKNAAKRMLEFREGIDRDMFALTLFGKSAKEAMDIVKVFNESTLKRAGELMEQLGLKMDKDGIEASKRYKQEIGALKVVFETVFIKIGQQVLGTLTALASWFNQAGPASAAVFGKSMVWLVEVFDFLLTRMQVFGELKDFLKSWPGTVLDDVKGYFATVGTLESATFAAGKQIPLNMYPSAQDDLRNKFGWAVDDILKKAEARMKALKMPPPPPTKSGADESASTKAGESFPNLKDEEKPDKSGKSGKQSSVVSEWQTELDRLKSLQENWATWSEANDLEFWQTKLAATKKGSDDWWAVWQKIAALQKTLNTQQKAELEKQAQEQAKAQDIYLQGVAQHAEAEFALEKQRIETLREMGKLSDQQALIETEKLEERQYQIKLNALWERLALQDLELSQQAEIYRKIEELQDKHRLRTAQIETKTAQESKRRWDQVATGLSGAVNNMLFSTQTMAQRVQGLLQNLTQHIIDVLIKRMVAGWAAGEAAKTASTTAGTAARTATEQGAQSAGMLSKLGTNLKEIMADAYKAAAGAYAAVAEIPIIGPILAPAAAAVAFAAVAAFGSGLPSAAGGWDIPEDSLVRVHAREMILPAQLADNVRTMTARGGAGGSGAMTLNFHGVVDGQSAVRFFRRHRSAMAKQITGSVRDFGLRRK